MSFLLNNLNRLDGFKSKGDEDQCIMCKKDNLLINISSWEFWQQIFEEFIESTVNTICLDCIYILDIRNTFKQKIYRRYVSTNIYLNFEQLFKSFINYKQFSRKHLIVLFFYIIFNYYQCCILNLIIGEIHVQLLKDLIELNVDKLLVYKIQTHE